MELVWEKTAASGMQDVAAIARIPNAPVTVTGNNGTVWRTIDDGHNFTQLPANGFRRMAAAPDGAVLWGVGTNGTLWWSKDLKNWTRKESNLTDGIEDIVVNYDGSIWVTTTKGHLYTMSDGKSFSWRPTFMKLKRIGVGPDNRFWAISSIGEVMRMDGGHQGAEWYDTLGRGMEDVSVSTEGDAWLVGSNGTLWTTRDGRSFTQTDGSAFRSVSAGPQGTIWATGTNGSLWKVMPKRASGPIPVTPPKDDPPVSAKKLTLSLSNQAGRYFDIEGVTWLISRNDLSGVSQIGVLQGGTGGPVVFQPPSNGNFLIGAQVHVFDKIQGQGILADFRGTVPVDSRKMFPFTWTNQGLSNIFWLIAESASPQATLFNPVAVLTSSTVG